MGSPLTERGEGGEVQLLIYHVEIFFESKSKFQDIVLGVAERQREATNGDGKMQRKSLEK